MPTPASDPRGLPPAESEVLDGSGELSLFLERSRASVDAMLPSLLPPPSSVEDRVREAMVYALLSPGKRMRPILTLLVAALYGARQGAVLPPACALEMVHAASLVLDDLPSMDGATHRRGRPATHAAYGEATAILAAVALLNHAYGIIASNEGGDGAAGPAGGSKRSEAARALIARRFSEAIGTHGAIGGQQADLSAEGRTLSLRELEFIHSHKTGSLFMASAELGAIVMGAPEEETAQLSGYAKNLGLAFQITDDILDVEGSEAVTGKTPGRDAGRTTFVTLCGVAGARQLATELVDAAVAHLDQLGPRSRLLRELAFFIARRDR